MAELAPKGNRSPDLRQIIAKNVVVVTAGNTALKAANFLFNVYVIRRLGDHRFGQYSIVLAFVGLFQIFAELGISQYVMREIARDRSKTPVLFWNLVALRFLLAIAGVIGITLAASTRYSPELVLGIFIYTCGFLLSAFEASLNIVIFANERLDYATIIGILGQVVSLMLGTLFMFLGLSYIWLIVAGLISMLPQIWLGTRVIRKHNMVNLKFQVDPKVWPTLIRAGLPFGIISLALTIAFSIDTVMLSMFVRENEVGWYNVAYNLARALLFFFGGFATAIVPSLTRAYANDAAEVERWYYRSVKLIMLSSLPIAVGGMMVAFPLIRFLYTNEFLPSALGLQILIWDVPLLMFTGFCGNMTTIVGEERAAARIYTINALANIILNLYAIPRYGMVGAALVTVITDLIGALQFHFLLRRKLHLPNMVSVGTRVVLAATMMGVAVYAMGDLNFFIIIGLGAVVYSALVLALRLLDEKEWALIKRLAQKFTGSQPTKEAA
ncbi:MAG: flippase [Chloroflexi bacterium]|nr:flippase [Chloroflexota bacterium]